jgi:hypothetical protein
MGPPRLGNWQQRKKQESLSWHVVGSANTQLLLKSSSANGNRGVLVPANTETWHARANVELFD